MGRCEPHWLIFLAEMRDKVSPAARAEIPPWPPPAFSKPDEAIRAQGGEGAGSAGLASASIFRACAAPMALYPLHATTAAARRR